MMYLIIMLILNEKLSVLKYILLYQIHKSKIINNM